MPTIRLLSNDGVEFIVDAEMMKCSPTIKKMLRHMSEDQYAEPIHLVHINAAILGKVIQWVIHHQNDDFDVNANDEDCDRIDEGPDDVDDNEEKIDDTYVPPYLTEISEWDKQFLDVNYETFIGLTKAASHLNITGLLHITCKTFADMIKEFGLKKISDLCKSAMPTPMEEDADEAYRGCSISHNDC